METKKVRQANSTKFNVYKEYLSSVHVDSEVWTISHKVGIIDVMLHNSATQNNHSRTLRLNRHCIYMADILQEMFVSKKSWTASIQGDSDPSVAPQKYNKKKFNNVSIFPLIQAKANVTVKKLRKKPKKLGNFWILP